VNFSLSKIRVDMRSIFKNKIKLYFPVCYQNLKNIDKSRFKYESVSRKDSILVNEQATFWFL
jgi:hypothetical protein